jgi:hypothetical protein
MNEEKETKETKDENIIVPPKVSTKEKKDTTVEDYFKGGLFVLLGIIITISALKFYFTVDNIIYTWFKHEYVPIIQAFYNLIVIVVSLYILKSYVLKKKEKK